MLPGIANIINNSYHATIEDVPFRIYHNRDPAQMKHHIIPDDVNWMLQHNSDQHNNNDEDDEEDDDSDDSDDESDADENNEQTTDAVSNITKNELYQNCASGSLSHFTYTNSETNTSETSLAGDVDELEDFDIKDFNFHLFCNAKTHQFQVVKTLEATEYAIHKNTERWNKLPTPSFKIRQRVLFRNPEFPTYNPRGGNSDMPRNLIGTITESCFGEMYMLKGKMMFTKRIFTKEKWSHYLLMMMVVSVNKAMAVVQAHSRLKNSIIA